MSDDTANIHSYGWLYALFAASGLLAFLVFSFYMYHRRLITRKRREWEYTAYLKELRPDLDGSRWKITRARKILTNTNGIYPCHEKKKRLQHDLDKDRLRQETSLSNSRNTSNAADSFISNADTVRAYLKDSRIQKERDVGHVSLQQVKESRQSVNAVMAGRHSLEPINHSYQTDKEQIPTKKKRRKKRLFKKSGQTKNVIPPYIEINENVIYYSQTSSQMDPEVLHLGSDKRISYNNMDITDIEYIPSYTKPKKSIDYTGDII